MLIVEIGQTPFIKFAYPRETLFFSTSAHRGEHSPKDGFQVVSAGTLPALNRSLRDPGLTLVVAHVARHSPWAPRTVLRDLGHRRVLKGDIALLRNFGPYLIGTPRAPVAVLDLEDQPLIARHNFGLWDRSTVYFKRELPSDRWRTIMTTGHFELPTPRMRREAHWRGRMAKLRPISLGLPLGAEADFAGVAENPEKTSDVFASGAVTGWSTARERGWAELQTMGAAGVRVDAPAERLARPLFYQRASQALMTWSPEGLGYDCFRHYEAAACGSVPLMNNPGIERYAPPLSGIHAVYYDVEPGGLARAVMAALAAPDQLRRMGEAAREHFRTHHTTAAIARHIIETTLAAADHARGG